MTMKNAKMMLFAAAFLLIISACRKETVPPSASGNGSWSATINGQQKTGVGSFVYQQSDNDLVLTMRPPATTSQWPQFDISYGLFTQATVTTGTYTINTFVAQATYTSDSTNNAKQYIGNNGQLVVTQFSITGKTVAGTFYYVGYYNGSNGAITDSVVVTNGTFTGPLSIL
jgi:hypothetical protein